MPGGASLTRPTKPSNVGRVRRSRHPAKPHIHKELKRHKGRFSFSRSLSFSLSRWFTGGFPPTSAPLVSSWLGRFRIVLTL
ncbi:hypothetical protein F3J31_21130 [Enterobacter sp. Acro-832]|nr:hypothetical protein [Enterobacter sp. Acro-832]